MHRKARFCPFYWHFIGTEFRLREGLVAGRFDASANECQWRRIFFSWNYGQRDHPNPPFSAGATARWESVANPAAKERVGGGVVVDFPPRSTDPPPRNPMQDRRVSKTPARVAGAETASDNAM